MRYDVCYISSNCNQVPTAVDWGKNNIICYGSSNAVLIYEVDYGSGGRVTKALTGHSKRVNSVKWLRGKNVEYETELISGSADGTAIVWSLQNGHYIPNILEGHKNNINVVDGLYKGENNTNTYVITASMDSTVKVWYRQTLGDNFQLLQDIVYDYSIAICLKITYFYENQLMFACALDSSKIQLFMQNSADIFEKSVLLSGHEDWVRGLDFVFDGHKNNINVVDGLYKGENNTNTYVITASMDSTVKVWYRQTLGDNFQLLQDIVYDYSIAICLKITYFYENQLMFACALDSSKIQLFMQNSADIFEKSVLLSGHEDWVRGLDFVFDGKDILLASGSQDNYIRLWRIKPQSITDTDSSSLNEENTNLIIKSKDEQYYVYLESLLTGHEGWIYSVNWSLNGSQILSASLDKTMIIWEYDQAAKLWLEKIRVGEVGGNTLGFYGGLFGPNGTKILAYSYHGAFHVWNRNEAGQWEPQVTVGGHFNEVNDLAWEPDGEFLISVSADQTTRVHAPWTDYGRSTTWHEIARPQVHGYDLSSLALLSRYKFVSGAEEKVLRVFEAPQNFIENFRRICGLNSDKIGDTLIKESQLAPKGASVPSLGLSNKAVYTDDNIEDTEPIDKKNPYPEESHFVAKTMTEPPTEETLIQNTLWPEEQKLYGHGYEIISLASSPDGKVMASACKSSKPEHAAILLWNTQNWQQTQKLMSHTLTVVQMQFSPDGNRLLSVSRDRRWTIFLKNKESSLYELEATTDKKTSVHTRIIWTCSWSHDSQFFATGSRDGKAIVWWRNMEKETNSIIGQYEPASENMEKKNNSVTAVTFAPKLIGDDYLIAVGFESGTIDIYKWNRIGWTNVLLLDVSIAHHLTVKKLTFRPLYYTTNKKEKVLQLASCSSDFSVKIYDIYLD